MSLTSREFWTVVHGMLLGAAFLLAFTGGLAGLWSLRPEYVTKAGASERLPRLTAGIWIMAIIAWLTVTIGTYVVYPWYRAAAPKELVARVTAPAVTDKDVSDLGQYPKVYLTKHPTKHLSGWHDFGMEWKEHVAWICPILVTAVAAVVLRYRKQLIDEPAIRRALIFLFVMAFLSAAAAGIFGAFINKIAPVH